MTHTSSPSLPSSGLRGILPGLFLLIALAAAFAIGAIASDSVRAKLGLAPDIQPKSDPSAPKQLWTCGMHPQVIQDHPGQCPICHMELTPLSADTAAATHDHGDGMTAGPSVIVDPVVVQNMGVRLAKAETGTLKRTIRLVGYVTEREPDHLDINLRVSGWIEKLYADTDGMLLKKGQPLFDLYSPEITVGIEELIAGRHAVDRAKQSNETQADRVAQTLYDSARRKLELWGLTPEQVADLAKADTSPKTVPILSPIGGHLTKKMVYQGAAVQSGMLALRIANRDRMWIEARAFEQQLPLIRPGQPARATLVAGRVYEGKVAFIHPHMDPATRTALVRIDVPNPDHALHEAMYATVELQATDTDRSVLAPRESIIDTGEREVVFVADPEAPGRFTPRAVTTGLHGDDGRVQILSGLSAGDSVVISGQFLLDSESRLREAIQKHLSANLASASGKPASPSTHPTIAVGHSDDILSAYLDLARTLGRPAENTDPLDVTNLINAATKSAVHSTGPGQPLAAAVTTAATAMKDQPQDEQRRLFQPLSNAVISLVRQAGLSQSVAPELSVIHCPMAFDDKGAYWLQTGRKIANPYYTKSMKTCGSITETIAARPQ